MSLLSGRRPELASHQRNALHSLPIPATPLDTRNACGNHSVKDNLPHLPLMGKISNSADAQSTSCACKLAILSWSLPQGLEH